jgi:predicted dienelactone hydrolase
MRPVLGPAMTKTSLAEIKVPVRIIVGSKDDQALPNVTHYTFLARCNLLGKVVARSFCTDPDQIDREEVHRRVGTDALKFCDRTLQREP